MPLSEEQQNSLNTLTHLANEFAGDGAKYEAFIRQAEVLQLFDTRGQKTDLTKSKRLLPRKR